MSAEDAVQSNDAQIHPLGLGVWTAALVQFIALLDSLRWQRRSQALLSTSEPYELKIIDDHYWLEMEWARCSSDLDRLGQLPNMLTLRSVAALEFAREAVATSHALSPDGQRVLAGRLSDGLNTGFADLYQEFSMAAQLRVAGWTVRFPDMEGTARHDIDAVRDGLTVCVECKTVSADAGRKIHRRHFYRFATMVQPTLSAAPVRGTEVLVVTMADRFPASRPDQLAIASHVRQCITTEVGQRLPGPGYTVHRDSLARSALTTPGAAQQTVASGDDIAHQVRSRYGANCHVAGQVLRGGTRLLVVVSAREDDTSRESLAARTKAAAQLPPTKPGIVAVQYGEITSADLFTEHFKRRLGILDAHFLAEQRARHVIGVHHSAFDGLHIRHGRLVTPAAASHRHSQHLAILRQMFDGEWPPSNGPGPG